MRKELLFAIGAGLILGLVIAFGIWRVNKTITPQNGPAQTSESSPTPQNGFSITLSNLDDREVVTSSTFEVEGLTKPETTIAISTEENDYLLKTDKDGSFAKKISLVAGVNQLVFKAFDREGKSSELKITVIYSSQFADYLKDETEEEKTATNEADAITQKVEQKVSQAKMKPTSYLGTITDISEENFQIENRQGEIEQIATNKDTDFVKVDKTSTNIKFSDVAIGDYIIAMGFRNGNSVLEAKRILVTSVVEQTSRDIIFGSLAEIVKKEIVVNQIGTMEEFVFAISPNTDYLAFENGETKKSSLTDLEEKNNIFAFVSKEDDLLEARTIFYIEEESEPVPSMEPEE